VAPASFGLDLLGRQLPVLLKVLDQQVVADFD
jgi:hypothetical protein